MKKVLAFDIDQTLNIAKTPIPEEIAEVLVGCLDYFEICPISGQKFEQFLVQIVDRLTGVTAKQLEHLHLFPAQGTQYYRYEVGTVDRSVEGADGRSVEGTDNGVRERMDGGVGGGMVARLGGSWRQVYNYPLSDEDVAKITETLEAAARELGYWEEDKLAEGDEIIENRQSQVTFSALGQRAGTQEKYAWDPKMKKRAEIVARCQERLPRFLYEIGGTTSINVAAPGMNKAFGMRHLLEELGVRKEDVLYFGDMTQPGGNDYPIVEMGVETVTVRSHEDTLYALRGILGVVR